jgi:hypothetical protein
MVKSGREGHEVRWGGVWKGQKKIAIASQRHHLLGLNIKRKEENCVSRSELPGIQFLVRERERTHIFSCEGKPRKNAKLLSAAVGLSFFAGVEDHSM